jgi:LPS-assembly protein
MTRLRPARLISGWLTSGRRVLPALGALAAVLVAALLLAAPAAAQLKSGSKQKQPSNAPIVFQADEVQYDEQHGLTIARGHVEISQGGDVLLADTVSYNQRTDTVTASGHVSLLLPTGEVLFSQFMELRDQMNDAFAENVRMLLADRSRLAAAAARRLNGNRTELAKAVYSPCDLCQKDPSKPPTWEMKAREITDDKQLKLIEFYDATMDIDGWPVFYSPYLSEPEPDVKRANGFLMPSFGDSSTVGFHISTPYFIVLGPDKDLTVDPRLMSGAGQLLATQYRERFGDGLIDATVSENYSNVGIAGTTDSDVADQWRGHVDATGTWDLDDTWRTGFQLERVSDQTYLQRFGFPVPLLNAMISRLYLEGFAPDAESDIAAYMFQPLQPGLGDSTEPIVLPVANRTWFMQPDGIGGTLKVNANLLDIVREVGTDDRRLSLGAEWDRIFFDGIGGKYVLTASVRGDGYSIDNLSNISNPDLPTAWFPQDGKPAVHPVSYDYDTGRAFPQIGLTWSYPLAHRGDVNTAIIEPIVGLYAGPNGGNSYRVPDEDSLGFEFNDTDLFRPDRLAGYDILDTGQRVDYGLKLALNNKDSGNYSMLVGQSYRAEDNAFLTPGSGAEDRLSDIVGRVVLQPVSYVDLIYHFRLDKATLDNRSQEVEVATGPQNLRFAVNFLLEPAQQPDEAVTLPTNGESILLGKREQVTFASQIRLTQYWSLAGRETLNLTNSNNLINGVAQPQSNSSSLYATVSAIYQDECMAFIGTITQSGIVNGDVTPGISVMFSVVFKNLGEIGGTVLEQTGAGL